MTTEPYTKDDDIVDALFNPEIMTATDIFNDEE